MANWTYNGVRIFVQKYTGSDSQTIARLGPLGAGTIFHVFGYEDTIIKISAYIVGLTDLAALKACKSTGSSYTLVSPVFSNTSYMLKNLEYELTEFICQTIRPDLPTTSPVFRVDLELYLDE